jgi:hypoxanthine phosphoribosyltransferase
MLIFAYCRREEAVSVELPVLIDREKIATRITEMAAELDGSFSNAKAVVIGILEGSFIFAADLVRQGRFTGEIDFVRVESYEGTESTGKIRMIHDFHVDVMGKDVLIVDDILDSGLTLSYMRDRILRKGAKSVRAAVLLRKEREKVDLTLAEHVGFVIPDEFVVGFGLDYNGRFRDLRDIRLYDPAQESK